MIRLFTGLSLPESQAQHLMLLQGGIPGARWTEEGNHHITLTFIGTVDEPTAEDIDDALEDVRAKKFQITVTGMNSFAQGDDPKVLWAGVSPSPDLSRLKEKIDRALEQRKLPFENRKYTPHVTLARFRRPDEAKIAQFIAAHNLLALAPFDVTAFHLYESAKGRYDIVKSYLLDPA